MFSRIALSTLLAIIALLGVVHAEDRVQAELRFVAHNKEEKTAGVWVDGQYVGSVKEVNGDKKVLLLPGKHEILVRQAWYQDHIEQAILEPGELHVVKLAMVRLARTPNHEATGELKISATPNRAAVFVDNQ